MVEGVSGNNPIFQSGIDTIKLIANSQHLPTSDEELFALAEFIDAYDAKLVADHGLYMQAKAKARAYIAQQLVENLKWDSRQSGAIGDMTHALREELLRRMEPKNPNA